MGSTDRSIFHRGVYMGLEVAYKAFVGDDAGFLEPIHPLSHIGVEVAARVSNGEEVLFINQIVGNFPEIYPHVMEVGNRVIELVVDDVCGCVAVPFAGVGGDRVEMYLEVQ